MRTILRSVLLILTILASREILHSEDLGPHDMAGAGCTNCHTTNTVDPTNVSGTYIWGDFSGTTYVTYNGETLAAGPELTDENPTFHSAACLICHDGSMALGMKMGITVTGGHPIDVPYRIGNAGYWPGVVASDTVRFEPTHFDAVYGHTVRFYVFSGVAYIECSSCHDPHNYSVAQVTIQGHTYAKPTAHFVRGWYDQNRTSNSTAQFCRSCHYEQSNEAYGLEAPTS